MRKEQSAEYQKIYALFLSNLQSERGTALIIQLLTESPYRESMLAMIAVAPTALYDAVIAAKKQNLFPVLNVILSAATIVARTIKQDKCDAEVFTSGNSDSDQKSVVPSQVLLRKQTVDRLNLSQSGFDILEIFKKSELAEIKLLVATGLKLTKRCAMEDNFERELLLFRCIFLRKDGQAILTYLLGPENPEQQEMLAFIRSNPGVAFTAAVNGKLNILIFLKDLGANFEFNWSPTYAEMYSVEVLEFLVSDQNPAKDYFLQSFWFSKIAIFNYVHSSRYRKELEICAMANSDFNIVRHGKTPLIEAICRKQFSAASFLVSGDHPARKSVVRSIDVLMGNDDRHTKQTENKDFSALFLVCANEFWDEKESLSLVGELSQAGASLKLPEANEKLISSLRCSEFRIVVLLLIGGATFSEEHFDEVKGKRNEIAKAIVELAPQLKRPARENYPSHRRQVLAFLKEVLEEPSSWLYRVFNKTGFLESTSASLGRLRRLYDSFQVRSGHSLAP